MFSSLQAEAQIVKRYVQLKGSRTGTKTDKCLPPILERARRKIHGKYGSCERHNVQRGKLAGILIFTDIVFKVPTLLSILKELVRPYRRT